ncbi:probable acyl-activating enzyme 6 [Pistacia vera]|uniref:probable acyl-activating enzyme 6 n=1 Tax=Pistacia vera TaxID=55513 RepID=UPI0012631437|nr:probable acyl-activating enzyme 6 [Pistacia vera]
MEELKPTSANSCPLTPLGFLERAATVYADSPSIIYHKTTHTWSQTHRRCLQLASSLSSLGIAKGHVVSVLAPNIPAIYELHFAVPFAGAILNNINTRLDARTVSVLLQHSQSKLVFVDHQSRSLLLNAVVLFPPNIKPPAVVLITDEYDASSQTVDSDFVCSYESLVEKGDPQFKWVRPESEWDPLVLNYTSGTTSAPKGVVHCHRGIFIVTVDSLTDWSVPKQPVFLWTLPMFHSNGWCFPWGMAAVGGTNICLRKFDASIIYDSIRRHGVTHMCGAPVVLNMLSNSPDNQPLNNSVKILTAGAPPPAAVLLRTESLGFVVSHGYGLTETGGIVVSCAWKSRWNVLPATDRARLKARQGVRTIGLTEADVVDPESGASVTRDGSSLGEIVLRGACIMLGYLKDPVGTRKCLKENGWFYTGDVGVMHTDGYLEIRDRSKDVIISGGENLSSVEVESVLYSHPAINEAAVVARPDEFWGETPCAFVSLRGELSMKPTEKEIIDYCRKRLPHYTVPKTVVFKEELPKTSTGKIQKFVLREIAKGMGSARVSRM